MFSRSNVFWLAMAGLSLVALSGAFVRLATGPPHAAAAPTTVAISSSPTPRPTPTKAPTVAAATSPTNALARQTTLVQRGLITDSLLANGRVAGDHETPVGFAIDGTIAAVDVQVGQQISEGQTLVELDSSTTNRAISDVSGRIAIEQQRLQAARQQTQAQQQAAIAAAQEQLRQALANQTTVQAGPAAADVSAAQGAVVTARTALDRANADYARLKAGPSQSAVQQARGQVAAAQASLQRAQNDQAALARGPTPDQIQAAQRDMATARAALDQAQANYDRLGKPSTYEVQAAQRAVDVATAQLQAAQAATVGESLTQQQKDAQVTAARAAVSDARDRLAQLTQPPTQADIAAATNRLDEAKFGVAVAQSHLDALQKGPDPATVAAGAANVQAQQMALTTAQQQLDDLLRPPGEDQLSAAQSAIDSAQIALDGAQQHYDDVTSHPTQVELANAQRQVTAAQNAVAGGQAPVALTSDDAAAQATLDQDSSQLASLQATLAAMQLRSPIDGAVVAIAARTGDAIHAGAAVITLSPPGDAVIRTVVNAPGASTPDVAQGQACTVQLDGGDGSQLAAQVASVAANPDGPGQIAVIQVDWGSVRPVYGTTTLVNIHVREKTDALILPARAVRSSGDRRYVDYVDGSTSRTVEVTLGIVNADRVEILSGLTEGQTVLLPAAGA